MVADSKRILVAEMDDGLANGLKTLLEGAGFQVMVTKNGFKAQSWGETETLAAAFINSKLEAMSGLQVAEAISRTKLNAKAHFFLVADADNDDFRKRGGQIRGATLIVKPTEAQDLVNKLNTLMAPAAAKAPPANSGTSHYDVRIINAFVDSVRETFVHYFGAEPKFGKASIKSSSKALGQVSSLISFTGESAKGSVGMSFETDFLVALGAKLFPGGGFEKSDVIFADMAGELCNQVTGAVKIKLATLGVKVLISLPKVVIGKDFQIVHIVKNPVIIMSVEQGSMKSSIEFCMTKNNDPIVEQPKEEEAVKGGDVLLF